MKRPLDLLEAFKMLNNPDYLLIFVGEGKLRKQMEDYVKQNGLQNVLLTGFVNQSQISKYYAIANVFVMCSEMETWGLSLNEAMNFELPVVISSTCGSSFDLVKDGVNGYIFQKSDVNELAKKIESVLLSEENLRKMGKESLEIINQYSIDVIVENIKKQIN